MKVFQGDSGKFLNRVSVGFCLCNISCVLQMILKQLCGSVLKSFWKSCQQHGELWSVELKQGNQHRLGCLLGTKYKPPSRLTTNTEKEGSNSRKY